MKKFLVFFIICAGVQTTAHAQCDKSYVITSSKTQYLDSTGKLQREQEENARIEVTTQNITIEHGDNPDETMTGKVTPVSCSWPVPFKEGKTVIRTFFDKGGDTVHATITFEGKDGKLTVLMVADEMPNKRIRLEMKTFEEKK